MKRRIKFLIFLMSCLLALQNVYQARADAPSLSLKDSIKIAEEALAKAKINVSDHFLYSIIFYHASKGDYWYYTYRPKTPSEYNEIFVRVYMDATTEISGGGSSRRGY